MPLARRQRSLSPACSVDLWTRWHSCLHGALRSAPFLARACALIAILSSQIHRGLDPHSHCRLTCRAGAAGSLCCCRARLACLRSYAVARRMCRPADALRLAGTLPRIVCSCWVGVRAAAVFSAMCPWLRCGLCWTSAHGGCVCFGTVSASHTAGRARPARCTACALLRAPEEARF